MSNDINIRFINVFKQILPLNYLDYYFFLYINLHTMKYFFFFFTNDLNTKTKIDSLAKTL